MVRRWRWFHVAALAAAASVVLVVLTLVDDHACREAMVRSRFEVYLDEGGRLQPLSSGSLVNVNAAIRFLARRTDRRLLVISVDSHGRVARFYPLEGPAASPPPHGILPDHAFVSDAPGPERIYAIYSDQPFGFDEVAEVARRALSRSPGMDVRALERLPIDLAQDSLLLEKKSRR